MSFAGNTDTFYDVKNFYSVLSHVILTLLKIVLPIASIAMITGVICSYMQVGPMFSMETLQFKLSKINPLSGFKRLFSLKSVVEMFKSIAKASVMIYITISYLVKEQAILVNIFDMDIPAIGANIWRISYNILIKNIIFLLVLAFLDYIYKKWQNEKDMRMSKQEIKEEYKQTEGDPFIKGKIKQKQREISMSRMMQEVPKADVVQKGKI